MLYENIMSFAAYTIQQLTIMKLFQFFFVPKSKLSEPKIDQGTKNEIQMLMK